MSWEDFEKIANCATQIVFCGQLSDPIHHPQFVEFLQLCNQNNIKVVVQTASTGKPESWYPRAFQACPTARWIFGIDGLPHQSHLYRVNQSGEKLFRVMLSARQMLLTKPVWQYIVFAYNENCIEQAKRMAFDNHLEFMIVRSSRWLSSSQLDPLRPTNPAYVAAGNHTTSTNLTQAAEPVKLQPRCCMGTQQLATTNRGYLIPCCYMDSPMGMEDPRLQRLLAVSKISENPSIEAILAKPEWQEFEQMLLNNLRGDWPASCVRHCRKRPSGEGLKIQEVYNASGKIREEIF
jgi:hypothetical protein